MINASPASLPKDTRYDVVVMNHVLEHVAAPSRLLEDVRARMAKEGLLHLAVPNVGCWGAKLPGWVSYQPYHFIYFAMNTIRKAVEDSGFTIIRAETRESFSGWFLATLHSLLPSLRARVQNGSAARHPYGSSWVHHVYRISMVLAGTATFPLRLLQASLGYGDELVLLCTPRRFPLSNRKPF